jgi:hypothetical protein
MLPPTSLLLQPQPSGLGSQSTAYLQPRQVRHAMASPLLLAKMERRSCDTVTQEQTGTASVPYRKYSPGRTIDISTHLEIHTCLFLYLTTIPHACDPPNRGAIEHAEPVLPESYSILLSQSLPVARYPSQPRLLALPYFSSARAKQPCPRIHTVEAIARAHSSF